MKRSDGILLVNKHQGITSFDIVFHLRKILHIKRIGHCGTLDPIATGLVIVCIGRTTKLSQFLSGEDKEYIAEFLLGTTTTTYDRLGETTNKADWSGVTENKLSEVIESFTGEIEQEVPAYSAVKVGGKRMYTYARDGATVEQRSRQVHIYELQLLEFEPPLVKISIVCSKGTYVRSLVNDIGTRLGCGAVMSGLCRQRIGRFMLEDAMNLRQIAARDSLGKLDEKIIDPAEALGLPRLAVMEERKQTVLSGGALFGKDIRSHSGDFSEGDRISVVDGKGDLLAIGNALIGSSNLGINGNQATTPVFKYLRVI